MYVKVCQKVKRTGLAYLLQHSSITREHVLSSFDVLMKPTNACKRLRVYMYLEDQRDAVLSSLYLFYCQVTLHVSDVSLTHHQVKSLESVTIKSV